MPSLTIRYKGAPSRVSLTPMSTLNEVLVDFCSKKKLSPGDWTLKHRKYGTPSMVTPFRLSKLDNNATLDLVPNTASAASSRKSVRVAVQTPERKRFQGTFQASQSLWQILVEIDSANKTNLLGRTSASGKYLEPSVTVATSRRTFTGIKALSSTSLKSVGIQGSTLLRVALKEVDMTLADAKAQAGCANKPNLNPDLVSKTSKLSVQATSSSSSSSAHEGKEPQLKKAKTDGDAATKKTAASDPSSSSAVALDTAATPEPAQKLTTGAQKENKATPMSVSVSPTSSSSSKSELSIENVNLAVRRLRGDAQDVELTAALQTLRHVLSKILKSDNIKFRSLRLSSSKLHTLLGRFGGGRQFLESVGFTKYRKQDGLYHVLKPEHEDPAFLKEALRIVNEELVLAIEEPELSQGSGADEKVGLGTLEPKIEKFDWAEKEDAEKKKEEELKKQEEKQRDLLERVQVVEPISFDWEKNKDDDKSAPVEPRNDIHMPEYNLADVREALTRLRADCSGDAKACCDSMKLLRSITKKLQDRPKKANYRRIKLSNAAVQRKIATKPGAMAYLRFLGFESQDGFLQLSAEKEMDIKTSRALSIISRVYAEIEVEVPLFSPSQRAFKVLDMENVDEKSFELLPKARVKSDAQLVAESMRESKLRKQLEGKILEREKLRRRYDKTVIRVVFRQEGVVFQGYFSPSERVLQVFQMVAQALEEAKSTSPSAFALRIPPQKDIKLSVHATKTLDELRLVPAATLNFLALGERPKIKAEVLQAKQPLAAEAIPKAINEDEIQRKINELIGGGSSGSGAMRNAARQKRRTKKKPKWMQLQEELGED